MSGGRFAPPPRPAEGGNIDGPDPAALRARLGAHQLAARPAVPPPDPGHIIGRVARNDGTELRVSLHRYEGRPFVRVGPWQSSAPNAWPVKGKGATVKVRELAAVAAALLDALDAIAAERANNDAPDRSPNDGRRQS